MIRGIEGRKIFGNNKDRNDFLDRRGKLLPMTKTACYAWVFMTNHAHFLIRTGLVPLSTVMRKLLTGYAVSFSRRHKRHGQLFQNRYKSIVCQEDAYFKELVRYIHLNPIRAGIVSGLKELDISLRELARRLERSSPGVGYSEERGEVIARIHKYLLMG